MVQINCLINECNITKTFLDDFKYCLKYRKYYFELKEKFFKFHKYFRNYKGILLIEIKDIIQINSDLDILFYNSFKKLKIQNKSLLQYIEEVIAFNNKLQKRL